MNIAITVITYIYTFVLGRAIVNLYKKGKYSDISISQVPIKYFYVIITLFLYGNIALVVNFLIPLKNLIYFIFPLSLLFIAIDQYKNKFIKFKFDNLVNLIVVPSILSTSTYGVWLGWDTGLYHIPHQLILRENPIVFGLTNLNIWFGWSSIIEYISSLLWLDANFVMLRVLEVCIFSLFFNLLYFFLIQKVNKLYLFTSYGLILFSFLDNFGYMGGGNGFASMLSVGKYDTAVGIIFFITSILIFNSLNEATYKKHELYALVALSLFSLQIKQTGAYLIFLLIPYLYVYIKKTNSKFFQIMSGLKFPLVVFSLWIVKNVITTSCLFYPADFTCIPMFSWAESNQLDFVSNTMIYPPVSFTSSISISEQAITWFNFSKNSQFIINFPLTVLLILIFFFFVTKKNASSILNNSLKNGFLAFLVINLIIWYNSNYGNVRYGTGLWLLIVSFISIKFASRSLNKPNLIANTMFILLIFSVVQTPRLYSYQALLDSNFGIEELEIDYENIDYDESTYGWGVFPVSSVQCWDIADCKVEDKDVEPFKYLHTIIFYPDNVGGN